MADTSFNSVAPAFMVAAFFLAVLGRVDWWNNQRLLYRGAATGGVLVFSVLPLFSGLSIAGLLLSLSPVFSIGTVVFLSLFIVRSLSRKGSRIELLNRKAMSLFCLWNIVAGAALYSGTLGLLPYDLYFTGYTFSWPFAVTGALTLLAIYFRSRLVFIFLVYVIAWNHALLPSPNFFDYVIDPFLFFASIGVLIYYGRSCFLEKKRAVQGR